MKRGRPYPRSMPRGLLAVASLAVCLPLLAATPQTVAEQLQRGREALQAGEYETAIEALGAASEKAPDNIEVRYLLGQARFLAGQIEAAIPDLEMARDRSGGIGAVQFVLGQAYLTLRRFADADVALRAAERERPDHPPISFFRADLCYQVGRLEAADILFERASELAPSWGLPPFRRGIIALDRDQPGRAADFLGRAADLQPDNAETLLVLATARFRLQDPSGALSSLQRAVARAPGFLPARLALTERYERLTRFEAMLEQVDAILGRWPHNATAHVQRARHRSLTGDLEGALADVEFAVAQMDKVPTGLPGVRPGDLWRLSGDLVTQAKSLRVNLLSRLGRTADALREAKSLIQSHPDFPDGYFLLGNLLRRAGDRPGAVETLARFKALTDARGHRLSGDGHLDAGKLALARPQYEAALRKNPDDPRALVSLAQIARRQGPSAEALELLERARGLGASAADWYRERILALMDAGQERDALAAWDDAQQIGIALVPEVWAQVYQAPAGCR